MGLRIYAPMTGTCIKMHRLERMFNIVNVIIAITIISITYPPLLQHPIVNAIAEKHGKTAAQVLPRCSMQYNIAVLIRGRTRADMCPSRGQRATYVNPKRVAPRPVAGAMRAGVLVIVHAIRRRALDLTAC